MIHNLGNPQELKDQILSGKIQGVRETRSRKVKITKESRTVSLTTPRLVGRITARVNPINFDLINSINGQPFVPRLKLERQFGRSLSPRPYRFQHHKSTTFNKRQSWQYCPMGSTHWFIRNSKPPQRDREGVWIIKLYKIFAVDQLRLTQPLINPKTRRKPKGVHLINCRRCRHVQAPAGFRSSTSADREIWYLCSKGYGINEDTRGVVK